MHSKIFTSLIDSFHVEIKEKVVLSEAENTFIVNLRNKHSLEIATDGEFINPKEVQFWANHEFSFEIQSDIILQNIKRMRDAAIEALSINPVFLTGYEMNILPKLRINQNQVLEAFYLQASERRNIDDIMKPDKERLLLGPITEKIEIEDYAINVLLKLEIPEYNILKRFIINTSEESHIEDILQVDNKFISLGMITKLLKLKRCAINILPKLAPP
eukprot:GHVP01071138.1.p1 GENE.GHVP01071138.1~~GHVP01071138.1.p1  ORF type:complete len:216 (+),score=45.02 GHVP01071138.1:128-775(+)